MLTKKQQKLADLLFNTKIQAKVRRRKKNSDGSFGFYLVVRNTSPFDFRIDPGEFVFKYHEKLPAAPLSPMYINLRNLPENLVEKIGEVMAQMPLDEKPDFCTAIPKAANPIAKQFTRFSGIPLIEILDKEEDTKARKIIPLKGARRGEGKKLIILDDLITKADSKLEAIAAAGKLGYKVVGIVILVDREQGGKEELKKRGYKLYSSYKLTDMLDYYLSKKMINKKQFKETLDYLESSRHLNV